MAFPEDLLEQAQHLARRERKKPKQASLRRAVSTAYYALFHLLITEATRNWRRVKDRHSLGRAFEHKRMNAASEKKGGEIKARLKARSAPSPELTAISQHLLKVTDAFIQLQQQRETADYDSSKQWSRTETLATVNTAVAAFQSWKTIRREDDPQAYLLSLLIKGR